MIKPDVHVKGGEYLPVDYHYDAGSQLVEGYGGEIEFVSILDGKFTSEIIKK